MPKAKKTEETNVAKKPATRAKSGTAAAPAEARSAQVQSIGEDQVRARAYELFLQRNGNNGSPEDDWYQAEAELRGKTA